MMQMTDNIALNQWLPIAYPGQVRPRSDYETILLGQRVSLQLDDHGKVSGHLISDDGSRGDAIPIVEKFSTLFSTLGDHPRPLPEIPEFEEDDRRIINCGSFKVRTSPCRIVENFLDMAHFSFVHTDILGSVERPEVLSYRTEHHQDVDEIWATDCQFFQPTASASAADSGTGLITRYTYRILSPFSVMLYKSALHFGDRLDAICLFIQPRSATDCFCFMPMAILDDVSTTTEIIDFQQSIFVQDSIILENQRPRLLPLTPSTETPTRADLSSIAYRRWLKSSGLRFGLWQSDTS